jgi:hypothetical protein
MRTIAELQNKRQSQADCRMERWQKKALNTFFEQTLLLILKFECFPLPFAPKGI